MKCPACNSVLKRTAYEGLPVHACTSCNGYLVATRRVAHIKNLPDTSVAELKDEALTEGSADREEKIRCPRCRRKMEIEVCPPPAAFQLDKCRECAHVWFDAGELARLQLAHMITPQGRERAAMIQRHREMTPAERAEFERNLANLPQSDSTLAAVFEEALTESVMTLAVGMAGQAARHHQLRRL
ncbi:MAG: hypothetical protein DWQ35_20660 [Planctomycetota bacterium]|nr:MAG: hypothetical protein DWQ35_20660 [Planctomycetota bacterium]REK40408.1 MAG: hypothetical protein DWQ46_16420 [Planctomycetota bacterium]